MEYNIIYSKFLQEVGMKKLALVLIVFVLSVSCISVFAEDVEYTLGEVIYHQNFADISDFSKTGIKVGTLSTSSASFVCDGEVLAVSIADSGRAYNILPDIKTGSSYTIELTFSFTDNTRGNGYIAFMLTCRGEEPSNITPIVFRADGTIDDFSEVPEELSKKIAAGEKITVSIPVEDDRLYHITVYTDDGDYHIERDSMINIAEGSMGLQYRNASVAVSEIYIVNGIDYFEKTGEYLDKSFADDDDFVVNPGIGEGGEGAPETSDNRFIIMLSLTVVTGVLALATVMKMFKHKKYD